MARAAGMSHTNVYKHFPSKIALQEAVAERWLEAISEPLAEIVSRRQRAPRKLEAWALALAESKARQVREDPELFATCPSSGNLRQMAG